MRFCEYMKKAREDARLTQECAAEKIGVSVTSIQNWEKNQIPSGKENLKKISEVYNVNHEEFWSYYSEEMLPRKNSKPKCDFPYFLFSEEEGKKIASLHLDVREQELLGLEYLYAQPNIISGKVSTDDRFSGPCNLTSKMENPLSYIPYDYIKEHGSFNTIALYDSLNKKLGEYKDSVVEYLKRHPNDIFDTNTIDSGELYEIFQPDIETVINILIDINESTDKKVRIFTEHFACPFNEYSVVKIEYEQDQVQYFLDNLKKHGDFDEVRQFVKENSKRTGTIEGNIIEDNFYGIDTIDEAIKKIEFKKWYGKYFKVSRDDINLYFSMTEEGEKLYKWYIEKGQDIVMLPTTVERLIKRFPELEKY